MKKSGTMETVRFLRKITFPIILLSILFFAACSSKFGGTETGNPTVIVVPNDAPTTGSGDGVIADTAPGSTAGMPIPVIVIAHGTNGSVDAPQQNVVITTDVDFTAFWSALFAGQVAKPIVDFNARMVIATVMGAENTDGYSIKMTTLTGFAGDLTVAVTATSPAANCAVADTATNPYHVISVVKSDDVVSFDVTEVIENCGE